MKTLKNFKAFFESAELDEILQNEENNFIVHKEGNVISGFEYLSDAFDHIVELIDSDGVIDETIKFELEDKISESLPSVDADLEDIDIDEVNTLLNDILEFFEIDNVYQITTTNTL